MMALMRRRVANAGRHNRRRRKKRRGMEGMGHEKDVGLVRFNYGSKKKPQIQKRQKLLEGARNIGGVA